MRVIAIVSGLVVVALAVVVAVRCKPARLFHARAGGGEGIRHEAGKAVPGPQAPHMKANTNPAAGSADGFYVGKGDQRVYVKYATADPVLRSFLQGVMDGSADPNVKGRQLFMTICAACHQRDGEGKEGVAPPLVGAEWAVAPGGGRLVRIVLNGLTGPVRVQGKDWNLLMPPWRENLDDHQAALVLTYVRSQLGSNHAGAITPEFVAAARKEGRAAPETSDSLLRISDR